MVESTTLKVMCSIILLKIHLVCKPSKAALHLIYKYINLKAGEAILTTPITF